MTRGHLNHTNNTIQQNTGHSVLLSEGPNLSKPSCSRDHLRVLGLEILSAYKSTTWVTPWWTTGLLNPTVGAPGRVDCEILPSELDGISPRCHLPREHEGLSRQSDPAPLREHAGGLRLHRFRRRLGVRHQLSIRRINFDGARSSPEDHHAACPPDRRTLSFSEGPTRLRGNSPTHSVAECINLSEAALRPTRSTHGPSRAPSV